MNYYIYLKSGRKIEIGKYEFEEILRNPDSVFNSGAFVVIFQYAGLKHIIVRNEIESIQQERINNQ